MLKVLLTSTLLCGIIVIAIAVAFTAPSQQNILQEVQPIYITGNSDDAFPLPIENNWYDPILAYFWV